MRCRIAISLKSLPPKANQLKGFEFMKSATTEPDMRDLTRILRLPAVSARTGDRKSSIYTKMKEGTFPKQVKIGPRAVGWIESEIEAHIRACIDASRPDDSK